MNNKFAKLVLLGNSVNRQRLQLILVILSLAMLILGIGAPADAGGPTRRSVLGV